ncbi:NAD(P)-dependent oxidoreductase [Ferruginibacter albus]|uniref:NAD(P)-dependent oxidoreductase n=1 Tax=Ferruginibacter albus TaxID=2875540 RepID=UPI001CC68306|nr:NAD(P)-dependent oxidoreductase [Ferruginibacter albus]UAY53105.1 NAD(P)-dependent oxidoreductase [Ferruginibacter albus]
MLTIGLIREGKVPADNRVALTPAQCRWLHKNSPEIKIIVQHSASRCFSDNDYTRAGIEVKEDLRECDILLGIKEVPVDMLIPNKTYLFFSHTKKMQPHNQKMFAAILQKEITLIDYECLEHEDGQRIIGFGFFAGIVGAHNGMMAYGNRMQLYQLQRVYENKDYRQLIHTYFGLKIPAIKIAVTGSGRVAHGVVEVMNLMGITEVEPDEYLERKFAYPVYVQLKGADLYTHNQTKTYKREDFHLHPGNYRSRFLPYSHCTDILINGVYWSDDVPRLFELSDINETFTIQTIADISDDERGSVPINIGDQSMKDPVYGIDRITKHKTAPYLSNSIDVMAVSNLPNELPRDASRYFGEQLIKYILEDLIKGGSSIIERATIVKNGTITKPYEYLTEYGKSSS